LCWTELTNQSAGFANFRQSLYALARGFIDAFEQATAPLSRHPAAGSPRDRRATPMNWACRALRERASASI
jgi:hypothetical protein